MIKKTLPLTPPYDRYLVQMLDKREQKTAGGIVIPVDLSHLDGLEAGNERVKGKREERKVEQREFKILARGPGLFLEAGVRQPMQYEVGQTILAIRPEEIDGLDWEGLRYYLISESAVLVGVDTVIMAPERAAPVQSDSITLTELETPYPVRTHQQFCGCGLPGCAVPAGHGTVS